VRESTQGCRSSYRKSITISWLSGEAGKEVLVPFPASRMKAWPISSRVNSQKNNDAEIVVPIEQEGKVSQMDRVEFSFDFRGDSNVADRLEF
jgi:hypothetical protein